MPANQMVRRMWLAAAAAAMAGCATVSVAPRWPEPRLLGRDLGAPPPDGRPAEEPKGVLALRGALGAALTGSPELAAHSWELRAAEARALQAGLAPNPELEMEVSEVGGTGELKGIDAAEAGVSVSQLIEVAGKRLKRARVAALEGGLAGWDYETTRLNVLTATAKAFVAVLAAQERVGLREESVRLAEQVLKTAAERVRSGKVPPLEETKAKVLAATSRIELRQAKLALEAARKRLAANWGSTAPAFERVGGRLGEPASPPPLAELAEALAANPDLARWDAEDELRAATLELEKANARGDVTVGAGVSWFNEINEGALMAGVSVPLPLYDRNQGGIREARALLEKARAQRRAAQVEVRTALADAHEALASAFAEADSLQRDVLPAAQAAFRAADEGYRQGKFGYLDVVDAEQTLVEAKQKRIDALAAYHTAVADIERLIGRPLKAPASP